MVGLDNSVIRQLTAAIDNCRTDDFIALVTTHPRAVDTPFLGGCLLRYVARHGNDNVKIASFLLGKGMHPESTLNPSMPPLTGALDAGAIKTAKLLLDSGADPNKDRSLIAAINAEKNSFELIKLLVEYGADVNVTFRLGGKKGPLVSPLSWAVMNSKHEIAEYLRSKGAVMPEERGVTPTTGREGQIVGYFNKQFGPVAQKSLIEIVPTNPPINIHVIPAGEGRDHITLFTTGMSARAMKVPRGGDRDYRFAEVFIQLPGDWDYRAVEDPNWGWPVVWLRMMGKYPHEHRTWLGGAVTIIAADDPPQPLAPNVGFTSMMLLAERSFADSKRQLIQLYRMFPLYTEEGALEMNDGIGALMQRFDRMGVGFIIDCNRSNVGIIR